MQTTTMTTSSLSEDGSAGSRIIALDVVSDVICPWCYIDRSRLRQAIDDVRKDGIAVDVTWRAYELNPAMPIEGMDRRAYRSAKFGSWERSRTLDDEVVREGRREGLDFVYERVSLTPNTRRAHRLARRALREGGTALQDAVVGGLFLSYFSLGEDVGDPETLVSIARGCRMATEGLGDHLRSDGDEAAVLAEEDRGRRAGLTGVPSVLSGNLLLYSGAQPAAAAADLLRRLQAGRDAAGRGSTSMGGEPGGDRSLVPGPSIFE